MRQEAGHVSTTRTTRAGGRYAILGKIRFLHSTSRRLRLPDMLELPYHLCTPAYSAPVHCTMYTRMMMCLSPLAFHLFCHSLTHSLTYITDGAAPDPACVAVCLAGSPHSRTPLRGVKQ